MDKRNFDLMRHSPYIYVIVISIVSFFNILTKPGIPHHGDMSFPYSIDTYLSRFYPLFNPHDSISNFESINRFFSGYLWGLIFKKMGFEADITIKLWLLSILIVSGLSYIYFLKFFYRTVLGKADISVKENIVFIFSTTIFMYSPWVIEQIQAPYYWLAYALTPLTIVYTVKYFNSPMIVDYNLLSLEILLLFISSTPHYTVFTLFIITLFVIIECLTNNSIRTKWQFLRKYITIIILFLFLNFYWIYPYVKSLSITPVTPGYVLTEEDVELFSRNSQIINVLRGLDQWTTWFKVPESWGYLLGSFVIPAMFMLLFLFKTLRVFFSNSLGTLVIVLFFGSSLLSQGANLLVYHYLVFNSPLSSLIGWIWRVPTKLSYLIWIVYPLFVAVFFSEVLLERINKKRVIMSFLLVILIIYFLLPKPMAYYGFYYASVDLPEEYYDLYEYLDMKELSGRVLFLAPYEEGFGKNELKFEASFTWNPQRLAGYSIHASAPVPSVGVYHVTSPYKKYVSFILEALRNNNKNTFLKMLKILNIQYIVYHNDIVGAKNVGNKDFQRLKSWLLLEKTFGDNIYLFQVPINTSQLRVFNNRVIVTDGGLKDIEYFETTTPIIWLNQRILSKYVVEELFKNPDVEIIPIVNDPNQLILTYLLPKDSVVMLSPFARTIHWKPENYFSRASTFNPFDSYFGWNNYIRARGIVDRLYFDFGSGIATTFSEKTSTTLTFSVTQEGAYTIYMYLLFCRDGGKINILIDNVSIGYVNLAPFKTYTPYDTFRWHNIGTVNLTSGLHSLTIVHDSRGTLNPHGSTSIGLIVVIPNEEYIRIVQELENTSWYALYKKQFILMKKGSEWRSNEPLCDGLYVIQNPTKTPIRIPKRWNVNISSTQYLLNVSSPRILHIMPNAQTQDTDLDLHPWLINKSCFYNMLIREYSNNSRPQNKIISIHRHNSASLDVTIKMSTLGILSFAEVFDPLWMAEIYKNDKFIKRVEPIPVFGAINGFFIDTTGEIRVHIIYMPHKWFNEGLVVSIISLMILVISVIVKEKRKRR